MGGKLVIDPDRESGFLQGTCGPARVRLGRSCVGNEDVGHPGNPQACEPFQDDRGMTRVIQLILIWVRAIPSLESAKLAVEQRNEPFGPVLRAHREAPGLLESRPAHAFDARPVA